MKIERKRVKQRGRHGEESAGTERKLENSTRKSKGETDSLYTVKLSISSLALPTRVC